MASESRLQVAVDGKRLHVTGRPSIVGSIVGAGFIALLGCLFLRFGIGATDTPESRWLFAGLAFAGAIVGLVVSLRKEHLTLDLSRDSFEHRREISVLSTAGRASALTGPIVAMERRGAFGVREYQLRFELDGGAVDMFAGHDRADLERVCSRIRDFLEGRRPPAERPAGHK